MSLFPLPIMRLVDAAKSMVTVLRANCAMFPVPIASKHAASWRRRWCSPKMAWPFSGCLVFAVETQRKVWRLLR